jgi:hypothetical protein
MPYKAYYIPNGPKNLGTFFPDIDFTQVEKYYIEVLDDADEVLATTTINEMDGECCEDKVRLHFVNYLGAVDAINFKLNEDEHDEINFISIDQIAACNKPVQRKSQ